MGVVVCVCSCCPDPAGERSAACSHWTPLAQFLYWMHSYTHFCMTTCVYFNIHTHMKTETTVRLQGQTSGSAASPLYLILFSVFPYPSLAVWASHLSALGLSSLPFLFSLPFLCRCSRSLLPISLSSSPPLLFRLSSPDGSTRDLLA